MPNRNDLQNECDLFSREAQSNLLQRVKALQSGLYARLLELFSTLDTDKKGKITYTVKNINKINQVVNFVKTATITFTPLLKSILGMIWSGKVKSKEWM